MPSRLLLSLPSPEHHHRTHHHNHLPAILAGSLAFALISLLFLFVFLYRKLSRHRTAPTSSSSSDLKSPTHLQTTNKCRHFSYSLLRRATASFSTSNRLGHGGFGCVYKAVLSSSSSLAVKVMDPNGSLQGEREFHNELSIASSLDSPYIVSLLGYSTDRRKRKLVLVYELMENRSLQEALMDRKCEELMDWSKRYSVMTDVARGLEYLHHFCNPPVIHGDVKPSNILLDSDFNAKIGDFGLARLKTEEIAECAVGEDNGSILEEAAESVAATTGYEDSSTTAAAGVDQSPVSLSSKVLDSDASPEAAARSVSEADRVSMESGRDLENGGGKKGGSRRDWWWKQDNGVESESGRVKDYVMEWIGSEISKENRSKPGWNNLESPSSVDNSLLTTTTSLKIEKKKKIRKRLEWWASLDEERRMKKKEKNRKPREWWKEEFCDELTKKNGKKKKKNSNRGGESWWQKDEDSDWTTSTTATKKKRKSRGSIDWWMDGLSGEFRRRNSSSHDWASGEIPKSGGISSTPSMRGTVCYIAPEYGGGGAGCQLSEKCDVYSFGVLLLVVVSGRRPLQVTASPMSEFERANLISWARQLAHNGKLLDLVDPLIHSLDKHQALLVITIALLCLQRSPSKRPSIKEIVEMLSGEADPPHLPFEFSPSPPSNFPFKSRKKAHR